MSDTDFHAPPVIPPFPVSPPPIQRFSPGPPQPPQEGNGLAIASTVLGIVSFVLGGPFCSVPGVILGHISLGKIRRGAMSREARGFARAGIILGWINIALVVGGLFLLVWFFFASHAGRVSPFVYSL